MMNNKNRVFHFAVTLSVIIFLIGHPILASAEVLSTAYTRDAVKVTFYESIDSVTLAMDGKTLLNPDITIRDETTVIKYKVPVSPDRLRKTPEGDGEHKKPSYYIYKVYVTEKTDGNTDIGITATYTSVQTDGTVITALLVIIKAIVAADQDGTNIVQITYGTPYNSAAAAGIFDPAAVQNIEVTVIDDDAAG